MALKQDERALLQLVCERGQSYADIAELLGGSVEEVQAKARAALGELGGSDPDAEVGLTDYLLGQADPIGRADAVRHLQQDPGSLVLAREVLTRLQAIAPTGEFPKLPEPRGKRRKAAMVPPGEVAPPPLTGQPLDAPERSRMSQRQSRMIAAMAAAGVILLFGVLAIAGVFSGGDSAAADPAAAAAEEQRKITSVKLDPQGGSAVAGQADFGLATDQLYVDLKLNGLDPNPPKDSVYVLWLMLTDKAGYPVTVLTPGQNGSVVDRYAVPTPVAVVVGSNARFVQVSESPAKDLQDRINQAVNSGAPLVPFSGTSLARGDIPLSSTTPPATAPPASTTTTPATTTTTPAAGG